MTTDPGSLQFQKGVVGKIAAYVVTAKGRRASGSARDAALKCILDLLGAAAVGIQDVGPSAIRRTVPTLFGTGNVPIWFTGEMSSVIGAAWANSSAAAALDLDDGNRYARGHPGAAIIPAALAVGHDVGATLEEILTAIVIGYEVGVTVGTARTTYGSSGTWTPYGVVAAAAALRHSSWSVVEHALAIAGESAPSQAFAGGPAPRNPAPEGAAVKEGIPWSVVTGLAALHLAEAGHTGPRNILDSVRHYTFPEGLSFGEPEKISATYFKPYACCRHIHAPLAALEDLLSNHEIIPGKIDEIHVEIHSAGLRISNRAEPQNLIDVQYSIPYCLALVTLYGSQSLLPVTADALGHPDVTLLAGKVSLALNAEFDDAYPDDILSRVTIRVGDRQFVSDPTPPKGEPLMTWQELETKFKAAARIAMTPTQAGNVLSAVTAMRNGDMTRLEQCISQPMIGSVLKVWAG